MTPVLVFPSELPETPEYYIFLLHGLCSHDTFVHRAEWLRFSVLCVERSSGVSLNQFFLVWGDRVNLERTDLARLASQQAPGSLLSLPFQNWRLQVYEAWPAFNICVLGLQNPGPHACKTRLYQWQHIPSPLTWSFMISQAIIRALVHRATGRRRSLKKLPVSPALGKYLVLV